MNKLTRGLATGTVAILLALSLGAVSSSVHASINVNNYGIDVFPSRKTHNQFAYQLRNRGHHSRVYFASANDKLGKAIFHNGGVPNIDYANYMARHEHKLYKAVNKKLDGRVAKRRGNKRARVVKRVRKNNKRTRRVRRNRINKKVQVKRHIKRYNHKAKNSRRGLKRRARKQRVYKARFKRSDNKRALQKSGFYNGYKVGGHFIFDKYAPNDKRAVVSKRANTSEWFQGTFGESGKYITVYDYNAPQHGWVLIHKGQPLPKNKAVKRA